LRMALAARDNFLCRGFTRLDERAFAVGGDGRRRDTVRPHLITSALRPRRQSHGEGCQARRFLHADYGGQEIGAEIPESGDEALGDSIAL
jgi:hypothetical protein